MSDNEVSDEEVSDEEVSDEEVSDEEVSDEEASEDEASDDVSETTEDSEGGAVHAIAVLEHVVKSVVGNPDAVVVNVDESGNTFSLTVEVGDGDMGRVIGRRGRIANAIRTVVRAAAVRDGVNVDVEFLD